MEGKKRVPSRTVGITELMDGKALRDALDAMNGIFGLRLKPGDLPPIEVRPSNDSVISYSYPDSRMSVSRQTLEELQDERRMAFLISQIYAARFADVEAQGKRMQTHGVTVLSQGISCLAYSCYLGAEKDVLPFHMLLEHLDLSDDKNMRERTHSHVLGMIQWIRDTASNYPLISVMSKQWKSSMGDAYLKMLFDRIYSTGESQESVVMMSGMLSTLLVGMSLHATLASNPKADMPAFMRHVASPTYIYKSINAMDEVTTAIFINEMDARLYAMESR